MKNNQTTNQKANQKANQITGPTTLSQTTKNIPVRHVLVSEEYAEQRIDNFLVTLLKGAPKTYIYRILRKGEVRVNKGRIKPSYRLKSGDSLRIPPMRLGSGNGNGNGNDNGNNDSRHALGGEGVHKKNNNQNEQGKGDWDTRFFSKPAKVKMKVQKALLSAILYEDEGLIILNKPAGLAVHGGSGVSLGVIESLRLLKPECKSLELVHRLDRDTSGCLMIAKKRSTLKWLHELLRTGQIEKTYWALVKGQWRGGKVVNLPLLKNQLSSGERIVRVDHERGAASITEFTVIQQFAKAAWMSVRPLTGRTHQIRVHTQAVGNPVACDLKYGDADFNRSLKNMGLSRLFLHAQSLSIPMPGKKESLVIDAPLEFNLKRLLDTLKLSDSESENLSEPKTVSKSENVFEN